MTGPMALHLVASSTATDTDWLARGHQLQVRVTSTDVPTLLPAGSTSTGTALSAAAVRVHEPPVNTIRCRGSYLVLPAAGRAEPRGSHDDRWRRGRRSACDSRPSPSGFGRPEESRRISRLSAAPGVTRTCSSTDPTWTLRIEHLFE